MKYFYQLGYSTCEDSSFFEFESEKFYSNDEWIKFCSSVLAKVIKNSGGGTEGFKYRSFLDIFRYPYIDEIYNELEKIGFHKLNFHGFLNVDGWAGIFEESKSDDEITKEVRDLILKESEEK